jgi:membrane protease YdiL (CAAX protease family)
LLVYLAAVFIGGALLAPGLYWSVQWLAEDWPTLQKLAGNPFHRFVNRSLLGVALVGLWPLLRSLQIKSWNDLGLAHPGRHWRQLIAALGLGFGSLATVAGVTLASGARHFDAEISALRLAEKLGAAALSAGVVAVLEEVLFRAALFGAMRKAWGWQKAMCVSSTIYALVHFFHRPEPPAEIHWSTGFVTLAQMLAGFAEARQLFPGFLNLTLVGMLLALAFQRAGNLYFSVGLHAGWIFWLKSYGLLTRELPGVALWVWGSGRLIDGWLAFGILVLCWPIVMRWTGPAEPSHCESGGSGG